MKYPACPHCGCSLIPAHQVVPKPEKDFSCANPACRREYSCAELGLEVGHEC